MKSAVILSCIVLRNDNTYDATEGGTNEKEDRFTLGELLMVIAIMGVLVALLAAESQMARRA